MSKIIGFVLTVVISAAVGFILGQQYGDELGWFDALTSTGAAPETVISEATPPPTDTPVPTDTPTPQPLEPAEAATTVPDMLPFAVQRYVLNIAPATDSFRQAMADLASRTEFPAVLDENWRKAITDNTLTIKLGYERIAQTVPPPEIQHLHGALVERFQECGQALDAYNAVLEAFQPASLDSARAGILTCRQGVMDTIGEFNRFVTENNLTVPGSPPL